METIPNEILKEYESLKNKFPKAWIGHNATTDNYFVSIFPISLTNSLMIRKVYQNG